MRAALCTDPWFELCYSIISCTDKPVTQDHVYLQVSYFIYSFKNVIIYFCNIKSFSYTAQLPQSCLRSWEVTLGLSYRNKDPSVLLWNSLCVPHHKGTFTIINVEAVVWTFHDKTTEQIEKRG